MSDKYTIELPIVKKSIGHSGIIDVAKTSELFFRDSLEQFARYFKHEFRYDNMQYCANEHTDQHVAYQGFIFTESTFDTMTEEDIETPTRLLGGGCFRNRNFKDGPVWVLDWVWIHPFMRNKGLLTKHWGYFKSHFGEFHVEPPYSKAMEYFLKKQKST